MTSIGHYIYIHINITALSAALVPDFSPIVSNFKTFDAVRVPNTQLLLQSMIDIQDAVRRNQPIKDAKVLEDHLLAGSRLLQQVSGK